MLAEIAGGVAAAPPVPRGFERAVFVGMASYPALIQAVDSDMLHRTAWRQDARICGLPVMRTYEFKGWCLREIGEEGRWVDVELTGGPTWTR